MMQIQAMNTPMGSDHLAAPSGPVKRIRSYTPAPAAPQVEGRPCFGSGTLITLADRRSRPIEFLRPGDRVLSYIVTHWRFVESTVEQVIPGPPRVTQQMIVVNGHLVAAPASAIYAADEGEYLAALVLRLGQGLRTVEEISLGVKSIEAIATGQDTYEVRLQGDPQNMFANGILVRNAPAAVQGAGGGEKSTGLNV